MGNQLGKESWQSKSRTWNERPLSNTHFNWCLRLSIFACLTEPKTLAKALEAKKHIASFVYCWSIRKPRIAFSIHKGLQVELLAVYLVPWGPCTPSYCLLREQVKHAHMVVRPPVARTGQHPWLRPGWKILPTRISYCSNTNCAAVSGVRITMLV